MLKHLSICVVLTAFGSSSLSAQQHEAVLQKMEVPGADFEIVLAVPKYPAAAIHDLGKLQGLVDGIARAAPTPDGRLVEDAEGHRVDHMVSSNKKSDKTEA